MTKAVQNRTSIGLLQIPTMNAIMENAKTS